MDEFANEPISMNRFLHEQIQEANFFYFQLIKDFSLFKSIYSSSELIQFILFPYVLMFFFQC